MMLRLLTVLFTLCLSVSAFSQEVFLGKQTKTPVNQKLNKEFKKFQVFELDVQALNKFTKSEADFFPIHFKLGTQYDWNIELYRRDLFSADYKAHVQTDKGIEVVDFDTDIAFAGNLKGNFEDEVTLTISDEYFGGMIEVGGEEYFIEPYRRFVPNAPKNLLVVYNGKDIHEKGGTCAAHEVSKKIKQFDNHIEDEKVGNGAEVVACYEMEYAIAGDLSMFNAYGSAAAVIGHTTNITNLSQNNYDDEFNHQVMFFIVTHFIVTTSNPWNASSNAVTYLGSFRGWGQGGGFGTNYDLAGCWTNINISGGTVGIAYINGLCGSFKYHVIEDFTSNTNTLRQVVSHEMGHNFNAEHNNPASGNIMDPVVNGSSTWSNGSISVINAKINSSINSGCFTACLGAAPPTANFTVTPPLGCASLTVQCNDLSLNGPSTWSWTVTLNGGVVFTSSMQNPSFTFVNPGCYNIELVASNGIGSSAPYSQLVTVNAAPSANFSWVNAGTTVIFTNLSTPSDPCLTPTSYLWTFGDGNSSTEVSPQHTYATEGFFNVTLTASNSCGTSSYFEEVSSFFPPSANFTADPTSGCAVLDVDFLNSSSSNALSALWTFEGGSPATSSDFSPSIQYFTPGTYDVTLEVCNPAGCDVLLMPDFIEILDQPTADAGAEKLIDCDNPEVDLDGSASSQGANYIYNWTTTNGNIVSGANTLMPTVDAPGEYCLEVIDNTGENCIANDCVLVIEDLFPPIADAGPQQFIDCNNSIAILDGTGSSQNGNFSYLWTGQGIISGETTLTPEVGEAGFFTLTVTNNDNGCTEEDETEVTEDFTLPIANAGPSMIIDCNNLQVQLDGTGSSQGANINYNWSGPSIISGGNTSTPLVDEVGLYVLIVTNTTSGCTEISDVIVGEDFTLPIANAGPNMAVDCNNTQVDLDGSASSQGGNYLYDWSGPNVVSGGNTLTPTVGSAGTYTLVVTNTLNGCTESSDAVVSENTDLPTASAGPSMELNCTVTSVDLDGSASSSGNNITYNWSGPSIVSGGDTTTPTVDASGTYTITVTDLDNGCTSTSDVEVIGDNTVPTASAGPNQQINCNNAIVALDGTGSSQGGGQTYSWSGPGIVSGGNTLTPEVNAIGMYTITVTGSNGCAETSDVEVTEDFTLPTADAGENMILNCSATSLNLNGTNSSQGNQYTYNWDGPNVVSGGTTLEPTIGIIGTYTLTVTNTDNGCTSTSDVEVTTTPPPSADISSQLNVDCNGNSTGEATVEGSGGASPYSYEWSTGGTEATETGLSEGTYQVTLTDTDQCTATTEVTITEPDPLTANASSTNLTFVNANDGTAIAEPNGGTSGYTYAWDNGETTQEISGLAPGDYTVVVTDINGCTNEETVTVSAFDCSGVGLEVFGEDALCNGSADGEVSALGTNGENPFTYSWSTGDMTTIVTNLTAGTYSVTATDDNGCALIDEITIGEPTLLEANISASTNIDCNGNSTGSASVAAEGGTPGYTYSWSTGGTDPTEMGMPAGVHTVIITDDHGCETISEIIITEPEPLTVNPTSTNESGVGASDGTATANPMGGTSDYTYSWDNGETTQIIENLSPGEYCVTITDMNGCEENACTTVNSFDCGAITSEFDVVEVSCNGSADGEATVNMNGGTFPYSYEWSSGDTGETAVELTAGEYEVTATDDNGCVIISAITVPEPDEVSVSLLNQTNVECEGQSNGSATVEAGGGNSGFTYQWSDGTTGPTIENIGAGTYTVVATDSNGCMGEMSVEISTDEDTAAPVVITQNIAVTLDENGMFTLTADMIDDGSFDNCDLTSLSLDITDLNCDHVGEVTVTLTGDDASGNSSFATAIVTVVDATAPTMTCPDDVITNNCASPIAYDVPTGEDLCGLVTVSLIEGLPSGSVFPTGATDVTWSGIDPSGNETTCSFTVNVQSDLNSDVESISPDCFGEENGSAIANPTGGTAPYTYQWDDSNMQMTQEAENLSAGIYNVVVTDNVGCIVAATIEVTQPDQVVSTLDDIQNENGSNSDGLISITPSGGTGTSYTYEWTKDGDFFSNEEDLANLSEGEYCVIITDENGCSTTECYTVEMINGTTNPELEQFITILPNPTSGLVNVNFQLNDSRNVKVEWFDYIGRLLIEGDQQIVTEKSFTFDLSDMASGVYLVRIVVDEDVLVKKVIVE